MSIPAERRIGNVIAGKWRVDSLLGSGSMAAVYSVTHRNGARAALKILHPNLCTDPAVCERFLGEGYLTNSVKHAGICRVLDDGMTDDGCVFLVMDLLEGRTLEAYREEHGGQLPLVEGLDVADKLMGVLAAVHEAGIVHRDLKLQNVFICDDGAVKLLDFGVARLFDGDSKGKQSTMFGVVLGTPSFMSPEQALGARDKVDHRSDIWSLGATLFTAFTGQTVHLGPNVQAKLVAAATVQARSIALVRQDLPAPIAAAIDRALRFEREERWPSVDAFRRALRDARRDLGLGKPSSVPPPSWLETSAEDGAPLEEDAVGKEETLITDLRGGKRLGSATQPQLRPPAPDDVPGGAPATRSTSPSFPEGRFRAALAAAPPSPPPGPRRSSLVPWVAGAVVAGALTGGAGFYLLKAPAATARLSVAEPPTSPLPATVSLAPKPTALAAPSPSAIPVAMPEVDPKEARDGSVARDAGAAGAISVARPAPTPERATAPRPKPKPPEPRPSASPSAPPAPPAPSATEEPAPAPTSVATDELAAPVPTPTPAPIPTPPPATSDRFATPD
jgi:serine/threonine-protein kinase